MSLAFRLRTTYCVTSHLSPQRGSPHTLAGVLEITSAEEYEEDLLNFVSAMKPRVLIGMHVECVVACKLGVLPLTRINSRGS